LARAGEVSVVEDWRRQALASRGIPAGWEAYPTPGGHPAYDFTVVDAGGGRRALHLKSHGDRSTIARLVNIDLAATPILEWSWKAVQLPQGADVRQAATSDLTGHVLVVWPRVPRPLRSRILVYAWDTAAPANTIERSRKASTVTFVIVRSGPTHLGQWLAERRNVYTDYRTVYSEDPDPVRAVGLSIDTNDTGAHAEAFVGPIAFRTPS
jgi:hypothetical protein